MKELPNNEKSLSFTDYTEYLIGHVCEHFEVFREDPDKTYQLRIVEIPQLLYRYLIEGMITKTNYDGIIQQLQSPDPENWFVAFSLLKQFKNQ